MSALQERTAVSAGRAEPVIKFLCVFGGEIDFLQGSHLSHL